VIDDVGIVAAIIPAAVITCSEPRGGGPVVGVSVSHFYHSGFFAIAVDDKPGAGFW
jgi:hypothetical protein